MANKYFDTDLDLDSDLLTSDVEVSTIKSLTNKELAESLDLPITICYNLADIDNTKYGFGQVFEQKDTMNYFSTMRKFTANSLNKLFEHRHDYHLYRSVVKGNLFKVLTSIYPNLTKGVLPEIYHFALYTAENEVADRTKGIRSPRIYFVLADYGRIYPLFFDPYHELNPMY